MGLPLVGERVVDRIVEAQIVDAGGQKAAYAHPGQQLGRRRVGNRGYQTGDNAEKLG
jgi:hypothetical protein